MRMVLSQLDVAIDRPSGAKAAPLTTPACPVSVTRSRPLSASQILTVLSQLAVAMDRPSGLKATAVRSPLWPRGPPFSGLREASGLFTLRSSLGCCEFGATSSSRDSRPGGMDCASGAIGEDCISRCYANFPWIFQALPGKETTFFLLAEPL